MVALAITNIILAVAIGIAGVAIIVDITRGSRPIVIKEAKALREYYEGKLEDMNKKTNEAEKGYIEYKGLYESELKRNRNMDSMMTRKNELETQVERLTHEINSCEDRISDMAEENAELKEQIKELEKPAKKKGKK